MVDTKRFQLAPECVIVVAEVAAILARDSDEGVISALELATYFPLDVERIGRILESLADEDDSVERVEEGDLIYYRFKAPEAYIQTAWDLREHKYLEDRDGLCRSLRSLKSKENWYRKLNDQHDLLSLIATSDRSPLDLSYFVSRSDISSARIQSILNDFDAERYISSEYDEETDTLSYIVPEFDYPGERLEANLAVLTRLDEEESARPVWAYALLAALILLTVLVVLLVL